MSGACSRGGCTDECPVTYGTNVLSRIKSRFVDDTGSRAVPPARFAVRDAGIRAQGPARCAAWRADSQTLLDHAIMATGDTVVRRTGGQAGISRSGVGLLLISTSFSLFPSLRWDRNRKEIDATAASATLAEFMPMRERERDREKKFAGSIARAMSPNLGATLPIKKRQWSRRAVGKSNLGRRATWRLLFCLSITPYTHARRNEATTRVVCLGSLSDR